MAELVFTILGCGSSGGVPRLGGHWGECDPTNPKNRRRRCALLVERVTETGITRVLIDTSPDLREQLLGAEVGRLDGVIYTHGHADHVHGIYDLRMIVFNQRERVRVWADAPTEERLRTGFGYAFEQPEGSPYPPILTLHPIEGDVTVDGAGGPITLTPFTVRHGSIDALGFRIEDLAYLPDASDLPNEARATLSDLKVWIVDALRRTPHPTHTHLEKTLNWIEQVAPDRAILTNMHIDMDYDTLVGELPEGIEPAFDGMRVTMPSNTEG